MNSDIENQTGDRIETSWEKFVPGRYFDTSTPLNVHLQDKHVNFVELSLRDCKRLAIVYFDKERKQVFIKGRRGIEIPLLVEHVESPFLVGSEASKNYKGFFGNAKIEILSKQCLVSVVEFCKDLNGVFYPVVKISSKGDNCIYCMVFQNPEPIPRPNEQPETAGIIKFVSRALKNCCARFPGSRKPKGE